MTDAAKLESVIAHGNRGHQPFHDSKIVCADGLSLSVIAGGSTYCTPRPSMCTCAYLGEAGVYPALNSREVAHDYPGPYTHVEVGFISAQPEPWDQWRPYLDDADYHPKAVFGYVPVQLVRALIAAHGGEKPL